MKAAAYVQSAEGFEVGGVKEWEEEEEEEKQGVITHVEVVLGRIVQDLEDSSGIMQRKVEAGAGPWQPLWKTASIFSVLPSHLTSKEGNLLNQALSSDKVPREKLEEKKLVRAVI